MPKPSISVLMAVHNSMEFLKGAVESILNQNYTDFEFIIIDDGSTDGSGEWLEAKAKEDQRIRLVRQANIGLTKSLNRGLALARGEFIARMDADDIAMPERFEMQIAELRNDETIVLLGSEVEIIDEEGRPLALRGHAQDHTEIRRRLLTGDGGALTHPAVVFRSSVARAIGGYDELMTTTQDLDFFLRMSEVGSVTNIPQVLLHWRLHAQSINHRQSSTWAEMRRHCVGNTISRIGVSRYLQELFPPMALGYPRTALACARWASGQSRYRTAAALYRHALRAPGQRFEALRGWCAVTLLRLATGIFARLRWLKATARSCRRSN